MLRKVAAGVVIAVAIVALGAQQAQAGWRWHGSSGGSFGSHGSHGSWGSRGSWGSSGGLLRHRVHYRISHYSHGSWGSSGGSYGSHGSWGSSGSHGSWGSSGGSYGSHGSHGSWGSSGGSYGSHGSHGSSGGHYHTVPKKAAPQKAPVKPSKPAGGKKGAKEASYKQGDAILSVRVPAKAKIYVNGQLTRSTGSQRSYVSRNLIADRPYIYEVRAEMERDGQIVRETLTAELQAGLTTELAFNFDQQPATAETTLKLQVPEDAKVYLAGEETVSTGPVRVFTTDSLAQGQTWTGYKVRVTIERDGRTVAKEQTITLNSGDSRELTFDFDAPKVAAAR